MIEEAYTEAIRGQGKAFVLGEQHRWLRAIASEQLANPAKFWSRLEGLPDAGRQIPNGVQTVLEKALPEKGLPYRLKARTAGMGSLGRPRLVALCEWRGGKVAREAKSFLPSACVWLHSCQATRAKQSTRPPAWPTAGQAGGPEPGPAPRRGPRCSGEEWVSQAVSNAVRAQDPFYRVAPGWVVRRLAPDCTKIEVAELSAKHDEARLLGAMGAEAANAHLGNRSVIAALRRDLAARKGGWLEEAAKKMREALLTDWEQWRKQA